MAVAADGDLYIAMGIGKDIPDNPVSGPRERAVRRRYYAWCCGHVTDVVFVQAAPLDDVWHFDFETSA